RDRAWRTTNSFGFGGGGSRGCRSCSLSQRVRGGGDLSAALLALYQGMDAPGTKVGQKHPPVRLTRERLVGGRRRWKAGMERCRRLYKTRWISKALRSDKDQIGEGRMMTSNYTHDTVPTQFVEANGIRFAYRRFGKRGAIPLLFLGYFNSNMDGWDPDVTNSLATDHEVILFDNAGVGASGGKTPDTVAEMTKHCVAFCGALGLKQIHVVGFSLGGMIGQQVALEH